MVLYATGQDGERAKQQRDTEGERERDILFYVCD